MKIHFAVDVEDHLVVAVESTDESVGDSKKAIPLIEESKKRKRRKKGLEVLGDGAMHMIFVIFLIIVQTKG